MWWPPILAIRKKKQWAERFAKIGIRTNKALYSTCLLPMGWRHHKQRTVGTAAPPPCPSHYVMHTCLASSIAGQLQHTPTAVCYIIFTYMCIYPLFLAKKNIWTDRKWWPIIKQLLHNCAGVSCPLWPTACRCLWGVCVRVLVELSDRVKNVFWTVNDVTGL